MYRAGKEGQEQDRNGKHGRRGKLINFFNIPVHDFEVTVSIEGNGTKSVIVTGPLRGKDLYFISAKAPIRNNRNN